MGPSVLRPGSGLDVRPHPHIGLATLTYLFRGEILHRDSPGTVRSDPPERGEPRVELELALPLAGFDNLAEAEEAAARLAEASREVDEVGKVTVSLVSASVNLGN